MQPENEQRGSPLQQELPSREQMQQVLQAGEQAAATLGAPVYNLAYKLALDETYQEWLATSPKEREKRESLWQSAQGLVNITMRMDGFIKEAQMLLQQQQAENDERSGRRPLEQQGFGAL